MKELLEEIIKGIDYRKKDRPKRSYEYNGETHYYIECNRGKGSKAYIIKRIDLLREKLLEEKKKLK